MSNNQLNVAKIPLNNPYSCIEVKWHIGQNLSKNSKIELVQRTHQMDPSLHGQNPVATWHQKDWPNVPSELQRIVWPFVGMYVDFSGVHYQQQPGSPDYGSVNVRISVPKAEIQATIEHCLDTHQATANIIVEATFLEAKSTMVPATLKGKTCVSILSSMKQNAAVAYYALGTIKVLISGVITGEKDPATKLWKPGATIQPQFELGGMTEITKTFPRSAEGMVTRVTAREATPILVIVRSAVMGHLKAIEKEGIDPDALDDEAQRTKAGIYLRSRDKTQYVTSELFSCI